MDKHSSELESTEPTRHPGFHTGLAWPHSSGIPAATERTAAAGSVVVIRSTRTSKSGLNLLEE